MTLSGGSVLMKDQGDHGSLQEKIHCPMLCKSCVRPLGYKICQGLEQAEEIMLILFTLIVLSESDRYNLKRGLQSFEGTP